MSIEEVRQVWLPRAEAKTKAIMDKYYAGRAEHGGGYGHEGLGAYSMYHERAAREKVRLAVKLLEQARLEVTFGSIHKVTGQSQGTIANYWLPPRPQPPEEQAETSTEKDPAKIIPFHKRP
jgi:hypothetical protein